MMVFKNLKVSGACKEVTSKNEKYVRSSQLELKFTIKTNDVLTFTIFPIHYQATSSTDEAERGFFGMSCDDGHGGGSSAGFRLVREIKNEGTKIIGAHFLRNDNVTSGPRKRHWWYPLASLSFVDDVSDIDGEKEDVTYYVEVASDPNPATHAYIQNAKLIGKKYSKT